VAEDRLDFNHIKCGMCGRVEDFHKIAPQEWIVFSFPEEQDSEEDVFAFACYACMLDVVSETRPEVIEALKDKAIEVLRDQVRNADLETAADAWKILRDFGVESDEPPLDEWGQAKPD
jgi:hypothetical protein